MALSQHMVNYSSNSLNRLGTWRRWLVAVDSRGIQGMMDDSVCLTWLPRATIYHRYIISVKISVLLEKNFRAHKSFSWGHWYPCFGLVIFSLGFKARVDPSHAWSMLSRLCTIDSSDSPLVQNLLISYRSAWQSSLFDRHTWRSCIKSRAEMSLLMKNTI